MGISSQISTLDEEISKAVQAQSVAGKQASKVRTPKNVPQRKFTVILSINIISRLEGCFHWKRVS